MAAFSDVDASGAAERLIAYLDATDAGLAAMKAYVAAACARAVPGGTVLDLGCGAGHDLRRLAAAGLAPIGIDPSAVMLREAAARAGVRGTALARADGAHLPFRDGALDGCRIERVLQHVEAPAVVVAEVRRILRPGAFVAVFEPDYGTFRVDSDVDPEGSLVARMLRVRHPRIGADLESLLGRHGFAIDDVVTESSRSTRFPQLPVDTTGVLERAVADGSTDDSTVRAWTDEQQQRDAAGTFRARWDKVLVVAHLA